MHARDPDGIGGFRPSGDQSTPRVDLGSNENPLGPSPAAMDALRAAVGDANRYPRAPHAALDRTLAERWGVDAEQIWLGPGAVGVIDYLSRSFLEPGDDVLEPDPGFFVIGRSAHIHHGRADRYRLDRDESFAFDPEAVLRRYDDHRMIYVISPHNPTGAEATLADIEAVAEATDEETVVVVDQAYGPFSERPSPIDLVKGRDDVVMVRTFSKAYGLAGLRLGYAVAPDEVASAYATFQTPYAASRPVCLAARAALEDEAFLERSVAVARRGRSYLRDAIEARTFPSAANFVLVEAGDARSAAAALADHGIRVRDCTGFGLPDCIRITVGTTDQNRFVADRVNEVLG